MRKVTWTDQNISVSVPEGASVLTAAHQAGIALDAPCGGNGACGKCKVDILDGKRPGVHRACQFAVTEDLHVRLHTPAKSERILETGLSRRLSGPDVVCRRSGTLPPTQIGDSRSVCRQIKDLLGQNVSIPLAAAADLYGQLPQTAELWGFVTVLDYMAAVCPPDGPCYALAYDIGTTTVVCYLLDCVSREQLASASCVNPQTTYGADVISRCLYDQAHPGKEQTRMIRQTLNQLAQEAAARAGVSKKDIYFASIAGNTCMQHLFLGVSTQTLTAAPYRPVVDELQLLPARSCALDIAPGGWAAVLPAIAGFVGGDTVGVLLSLPEDTFDRLTLVVDIGTNGEMVLGDGKRRVACSTAAGPAFEGAKIQCGMRGAEGAIAHARFAHGELKLEVIGGCEATGICGSGLLEIVHCLLDLGIVSDGGRFEKPANWKPEALPLADRLSKVDRVTVFHLTDRVFLSQKDIRELQLAKAAIAAGIDLLCRSLGVRQEDIRSVLLAGAFGNNMSPDSACRIGMIPRVLRDRIRPIGNAAGAGAVCAALDRDALLRSSQIARDVGFVELATDPDFQNVYFSHLNFPKNGSAAP